LFVWLGIAPYDRATWALENVVTAAACIALLLSRRKAPFSNLSFTLIFIFGALHEVGSHYTYSLVPYDDWSAALFGTSISELTGWQRNHYDRLLHLLYGLLLTYPLREFFFRVADARGFWDYYLPLNVVIASSVIYELLEWGAAVVFGGDVGTAYLGTQGDEWDAQRDMALAALGSLIAMLLTLAVNIVYQKDFHREWSASLAVKHPEPLPEETIRRQEAAPGAQTGA